MGSMRMLGGVQGVQDGGQDASLGYASTGKYAERADPWLTRKYRSLR